MISLSSSCTDANRSRSSSTTPSAASTPSFDSRLLREAPGSGASFDAFSPVEASADEGSAGVDDSRSASWASDEGVSVGFDVLTGLCRQLIRWFRVRGAASGRQCRAGVGHLQVVRLRYVNVRSESLSAASRGRSSTPAVQDSRAGGQPPAPPLRHRTSIEGRTRGDRRHRGDRTLRVPGSESPLRSRLGSQSVRLKTPRRPRRNHPSGSRYASSISPVCSRECDVCRSQRFGAFRA